MKTVLIIAFTDLARDPRVFRQAKALRKHYRVVTAGLARTGLPGIEHVDLVVEPKGVLGFGLAALRLALRRHESYYWNRSAVADALTKLASLTPDLVIANDTETLPLAARLVEPKQILFDAHEYAPREFDNFTWRLLFEPLQDWICQHFIPRVGGMMTVCDGIADLYKQDTGLRPTVVTNAPPFAADIEPRESQLPIALVHHGIGARPRKLENLIETMDLLDDRFTLDLVLVEGDAAYIKELKMRAAGQPRIRFPDPVPMPELPKFLSVYDVGVCFVPPTNINYAHGLPNKFFEWIQARLAIAVGPSAEMARRVDQYGLGLVASDYEPKTLAAQLSALSLERLDEFKSNAHKAAREMCAERNEHILLDLLSKLSNSNQQRAEVHAD